jgi:hypothetical protein
VKPLVNIVVEGFKSFFWQNIICRFGVLENIIVDSAKQFVCHIFKGFCHQMGVEAVFASVYHLQSNRAVERSNALIFWQSKKSLKTSRRANGQRNYRGMCGATTHLSP